MPYSAMCIHTNEELSSMIIFRTYHCALSAFSVAWCKPPEVVVKYHIFERYCVFVNRLGLAIDQISRADFSSQSDPVC